MSRTLRSITLTLALLVLCSSATYALPSAGRLTPEDVFAALWARVAAWFAPGVPASGGEKAGEAGSSMAPNGMPVDNTLLDGLESEEGSSMDPNGNK